MGITKKINWQNIFIFLFLVVFPFGQLIRFNLNLAGISVPLLPLDIIAGCAGIYAIIYKLKKPEIFRHLSFFLSIAAFSFVFSIIIFKSAYLIYGLFYLIRISAYLYFFVYVWNFAKKSLANKNLLTNSLLGITVASAIFGWIQFFMIPDIKALFVYGWDMHMFRLVGTFLDPTFLGLILVFGLIIAMYRYIDTKDKRLIGIIVFLLISLAFTYSRASYLAFAVGIGVFGLAKNKFKKIILVLLGLALLVFLLPTAKNHSIELTRTFSVIARFDNYKETLKIVKELPLFGVGFNNMCLARNIYIGSESFASHACSGSDSSLLFIFATTGIVGLLVFFGLILNIFQKIKSLPNFKILLAVGAALFVHSVFSNSLFYPWVIGYVLVLLAVDLKE